MNNYFVGEIDEIASLKSLNARYNTTIVAQTDEIVKLKALNAELVSVLKDARDRMFGSSASILALAKRADAVLAKCTV